MKKLLKKLKGFTLIELLAVIVILAVISLIAVPIVLNIINDSRRSAAIESARSYVKAVNFKIAEEELKDNIITDGDYVIGNNALAVTVKNSENIIGMYSIQDNYVIWAGLCVNNFPIEYSAVSGNTFISEDNNYCEGEFPHIFVEPEGEILSNVCEDESKYTSNTNFKIKTVEDLACLSQLTNGGKNFSGKTIYLVNNLDIADATNYTDSTKNEYGDINGNGVVDSLLVELTTGKGYKPNGEFSGTLEGFAFKLSNLMINRPNENNVGLFSNNRGSVIGLVLRNTTITGYDYVGMITGSINPPGLVKNVDVQGSVSGRQYVGGITGYMVNSGSSITEFVVKANVSSAGYATGGVVGWTINAGNPITGIVYDTVITTTSANSWVGKVVGGGNVGGMTVVSSSTTRSTGGSGNDGITYTSPSIALFDKVVDTIVGGDKGNDRYYFDFDENGVITLLSTDRVPIRTLKQSGTESSPYIISNTSDWKRAATNLDSSTHSYYVLTADLDFAGKEFYPMGTTDNAFNGTFIGNNHTISNVTVNGYENVGVFGNCTSGTVIKDVNFNNISITATNNYAGIVATTAGSINGVIARNISVSGYDYVGLVTGSLSSPGSIKNIDIQGSVSGRQYVGGITGHVGNSGSSIKDFVVKATISSAGYATGGVTGWTINAGNQINGLVYDTTITTTSANSWVGKVAGGGNLGGMTVVSSSTTKNTGDSGRDGVSYTTPDIMLFDKSLDTILSGDDDKDGYYFDFDENGIIKMYLTKYNPLPTISGQGTESSPYIIANADDWRAATVTVDGTNSYYYSLTNDIDFTGKKYYPLGTGSHAFKGTFNGNHHTISNININAYDYVGVFGILPSGSTVKDINFNNISITALSTSNDVYTGIIPSAQGTINGIKARNVSVTGKNYTGIITGSLSSPGKIKNVDVQGTVSGRQYVGGITGHVGNSGSSIKDFVVKATISSDGYATGGVSGWTINAGNPIKGVVYDTAITTTSANSWVGKAVGGGNTSGVSVMVSSSTTKSTGDSGNDGTAFTTVTLDAVDSVIDTTIGGDNDGDGYYFTLTNGEYELVTAN